jgi:hypothetical protein
MIKYGLEKKQRVDLQSLDRDKIQARMIKELELDLGIDLPEILDAFRKYPSGGGGPGLSAGAVYEEGEAHVRGVEPGRVLKDRTTTVCVLGHGWDEKLEVTFVAPPLSGSADVKGTVLRVDSDVDIWQRAYVEVKLPATGSWLIRAHVSTKPNPDSTENVLLEVVA